MKRATVAFTAGVALSIVAPPTSRADVGASGAYTTSFAVEVPPYHGLEPHITLAYSSSGGDGLAGVGWHVESGPTIVRASPGRGVPRFDVTDIFLLDGVELVPCQTGSTSPSCTNPDGTGGGEYFSTKIEDYRRIKFLDGTWYIWDRDGRRTTLRPQAFGSVASDYRWQTTEVRDTHGNHVDYSYACDAVSGSASSMRECYLDKIRYGHGAWLTTFGGLAEVSFSYQMRTDPMTYAMGGDLGLVRKRLGSISVKLGSSQIRAYQLRYASSITTGRSVLTGVQEYGSDAQLCAAPGPCTCTTDPTGKCQAGDVIAGTALPEHTFASPSLGTVATDWALASVTASTAVGAAPGTPWPTMTPFQASNWIADNDVIVIPADVNGDGRVDFVYPMIYDNGTARNAISFSTAIAGPGGSLTFVDDYFPTIYWPRDANGDFWNTAQWFAGDFNRDRNADIYMVLRSPTCAAGMTPNGNGECPHVVLGVAKSKGDGHYDLVTKDTVLPFEAYHRNVYALTISAYAGGGQGGAGVGVSVGLSSGGNTGPTGTSTNGFNASSSTPGFTLWYNATVFGDQRLAVADANGDGRDDLMVATVHDIGNHTYDIGLQTAVVNGDTFDDSAPEQMAGWNVIDTNVKKTRMFTADANGDGRADWMVVHDHEANRPGDPLTADHVALNVALADTSGTMYSLASLDGLGPWVDSDHWLPSDVDGDGRADFVQISMDSADSVSTGEHASIRSFLSDGTGLAYRTGPAIDTGISWLWAHPWCTEPAPEAMFFASDYDGDGRGDIMAVWGTNGGCQFNGSADIQQAFMLSRPTGYAMSTRSTGVNVMVKDPSHPTQQAVFAVGDVNGDGLPDLLIGKGHGTWVYDPMQKYDVTTILTPYPARDTGRYLVADITGDGRDDLILPVFMNPGYRIITQIQQADGSFLTATTGVPGKPDQIFTGTDTLTAAEAWKWMIGDVGSPTSTAPDGKADLVLVDYPAGVLRIYTLFSVGDGGWDGRVDHPLNGSYPSRGGHDWRMLRLNRDGRADLVDIRYDNGLSLETFLANGDGTWTTGSMTVTPAPYVMDDTAEWRTMDVNDDGLDELVYIRAMFGSPSVATEVRTFFPTDDPSLWTDVLDTPDVYNLDVNSWQPMELNGDGAIDLGRLHHDASTGQLVIEAMLSRGNGTWSVEKPVAIAAPSGYGDVTDTAHYRVADINDDGLTDFVHIAPFLDGGVTRTGVLVLEHDLSGWRAMPQNVDVSATEASRYRIDDLDADGTADIFAIDPGVRLIRRGVPSDRIATEANGFGAVTAVTYGTSTDVHANVDGMRLPIVTATTATNTIPTRTDVITTYLYDEAHWSHAERRWLGFARMVATTGDAIDDQRFQVTDACGLAPLSTALYDATRPHGHDLITQTVYDSIASGPAPYTCLVVARQDTECEGTATCRTTSQRWEYDGFGNAIRSFVNDLDGDFTDDRLTETPVWPNGEAYIVALPAWRNTYRCTAWSSSWCSWEHMSSTLFEYDDNIDDGDGPGYAKQPTIGELRRVRPWSNRDWNYPTTSYDYDASGNLTDMVDPSGKITSVGYDWGACPHRYFDVFPCALKVWNPSGPQLTTYIAWDAVAGKPNRVTDPNGNWTDRTYDVLGRPRRTTDPAGRYTELSYLSWGSGSQRVRTETTDASPLDGVLWSEDYFDGRNRIYKTRREGNGSPIIREATFDGMTNGLAAQSNDYVSVGDRVWTTYERDAARRVSAIVNPDGTQRTIAYDVGTVTTTDERDKEVKETINTLGRISEVRERLKVFRDNAWVTTYAYTRYGFDGSGPWYGDSVDTITDDAGNVTTTTRDSRALVREACDPDRGCWQAGYRDDGLVEWQGDAKWQSTRFRYDLIGRLVGKDYYDPSNSQTRYAAFAWDVDPYTGQPHGASMGRLTYSLDSTVGAEDSWTYDATGRVSDEQRCVMGTCGTLGYTYDRGGRIDTVRYPDNEIVQYWYDMAGELAGVPGYVTDLRHRPDGQPSLMCLTDSTCTSWGYDSQRQWPTSIDVMKVVPPATNSTTYLDRVSLGHDPAGLISAMRTTVGSTTLTRKYGYDSLGRLLSMSVSGQPSLNRAYTYDTIGNLTSSTTQGTYSYDPAHVHAASATSAETLTHDLDGNVEAVFDAATGAYRRYTMWDETNRPSIVWSTNASGWWNVAMYGYDAGGERVVKDDGSGRTLYFGNLAELDPSGRWIKYYYVDGARVARRDSTGVTYYHTDQLGSPRLITDAAGTAVTRYEWQPFGELQSSSGPQTNNRTFTGALADADVGLIQMGARFYDPALGQFVSADSIIPDRYSPQTLNRYAYALDNPVGLIDPSGHQAICAGMELCQPIKPRTGNPGEWAPYAPEPPLSAPPMVEAPPPPPSPPPLVTGSFGGPGDGTGGGGETSYANDGNTGAMGGSGGEPTPPPGHGGFSGDFFFFAGLELEGKVPLANVHVGGTTEAMKIWGVNEHGPYKEEAVAAGGSVEAEYGEAEAYVGAYVITAKMLCCNEEEMAHGEHHGLLTEAGLGHLYVGTYGYPGKNGWKDNGAYVGLRGGPVFAGIGWSWEGALGVLTIGSVTPSDVSQWWNAFKDSMSNAFSGENPPGL